MVELTFAEEQAMKIVWDAKRHGTNEMSMVQIQSELKNQYGIELARQTVSTFLLHITQKGFLTTEKRGRVTYYKPVIKLAEYRQY